MITAIGIMIGLYTLNRYWMVFKKDSQYIGTPQCLFLLFSIVITILCLLIILLKDAMSM